jgi:hypothetical protein
LKTLLLWKSPLFELSSLDNSQQGATRQSHCHALWTALFHAKSRDVRLTGRVAAVTGGNEGTLVARKAGKIINITSEYSSFGNQIAPTYAASKGAMAQLSKSMAIELASYNVQVNAIVPDWIDSHMTAPIKSRAFYLRSCVLRREDSAPRRNVVAWRSFSPHTRQTSSQAPLFSSTAVMRLAESGGRLVSSPDIVTFS